MNAMHVSSILRLVHSLRPLRIATLLLFLWAAWGCVNNQEEVAGGNDFPNTLEGLGKSAAEGVAQADLWQEEAVFSAPEADFSPERTLELTDSAAAKATAAVGKASASTVTESTQAWVTQTQWDFGVPAVGVARFIRRRMDTRFLPRDTVAVADTFWMQDDAMARDSSLDGDERVFLVRGGEADSRRSIYLTLYAYRDADGDSNLTTAASGRPLAEAEFHSYLRNGLSTHKHMRLEPGESGSFRNAADARVVKGSATTLRGTDTLEHSTWADADGDGYAYHPELDSGEVDVRLIRPNPVLQPFVKRLEAYSRIRWYRETGKKNLAIRRRERRDRVLGGTEELLILRSDGDSTFLPSDTIEMHHVLRPASGDSLSERRNLFVYISGPDGRRATEDSLLSLRMEKGFSRGRVASLVFSFTAARPLAHGWIPDSGSFSLRWNLADGNWHEVQGNLTPEGLLGNHSDSRGRERRLDWDRQGRLRTTN